MKIDLKQFFPKISKECEQDIIWRGCSSDVSIPEGAWKDVTTPPQVCKKMVDLLGDLKEKSIAVVFNVEFIKELISRSVSQSQICFAADDVAKVKFIESNYDSIRCSLIERRDRSSIAEALKTFNQRFDKVLMNPPSTAHIGAFVEASKFLKDDGVIMSLNPLTQWKRYELYGDEIPIKDTCVAYMFPLDEEFFTMFSKTPRSELGVVTNDLSMRVSSLDNAPLLRKMKAKLEEAIKIGGLLENVTERSYDCTGEYPISFAIGVPLIATGGTRCSWHSTSRKFNISTESKGKGLVLRYYAKDKQEQIRIHRFYCDPMLRFINKEFGYGHIPYNILPFISGFVDKNGKSAIDEGWTFPDLCKYFDLTLDEVKTVKARMNRYLYDDDRKLIDSTIESYENAQSDLQF